MNCAEIRKMSEEELNKKENDLREELANLSFKHRIRPLENTAKIGEIKKDIARILTVRSEKQDS